MAGKPTYEELEQRVEELEKADNERTSFDRKLQLLSLAVDQSSEGVAVSGLDGNLQYLNNAFAEMHGYSATELVGKNLSIFHTPEQMPYVEAANLELKQKGNFTGKIWHVKRDGTVFPTIMHNTLIRDETNKPIGIMGTIRDITDFKQKEAALQESEKRYRLLAENVSDIIWTTDMDLKMTYISPSNEKASGYTVEEVLSLTVEDLLTPDSLATAMKVLTEELEIEKSKDKDLFRSRTLELESIQKDGSTIWEEIRFSFLRDANGKANGISEPCGNWSAI